MIMMMASSACRKPLIVCWLMLSLASPFTDAAEENKTLNQTVECQPSHSHYGRFPVAEFDFQHVETPLIVSACVLFVSISKVGESAAMFGCLTFVWI